MRERTRRSTSKAIDGACQDLEEDEVWLSHVTQSRYASWYLDALAQGFRGCREAQGRMAEVGYGHTTGGVSMPYA